jgi:hypothetical protein
VQVILDIRRDIQRFQADGARKDMVEALKDQFIATRHQAATKAEAVRMLALDLFRARLHSGSRIPRGGAESPARARDRGQSDPAQGPHRCLGRRLCSWARPSAQGLRELRRPLGPGWQSLGAAGAGLPQSVTNCRSPQVDREPSWPRS